MVTSRGGTNRKRKPKFRRRFRQGKGLQRSLPCGVKNAGRQHKWQVEGNARDATREAQNSSGRKRRIGPVGPGPRKREQKYGWAR